MPEETVREKEPTIEELFGQLDTAIAALESSDITLEESFKQYQRGMSIMKACNEKIDLVEKKMLVLDDHGATSEF